MGIESIVVTNGAPVTVQGLSAISGANTMWVGGSPGEQIRVAISGGGQVVGAGGSLAGADATYTVNSAGKIDPPVKIVLPSSINTRGDVLAVVSDETGGSHQLVLSFSPLLRGVGKIRWYGVAQGAPIGTDHYGELFADIDQGSVLGPMLLVGVRANTGGVTLIDAVPQGAMGRLAVDDKGCASIRVQSAYAQAVGLQCSLPNSADGEVLSAKVTFIRTLW